MPNTILLPILISSLFFTYTFPGIILWFPKEHKTCSLLIQMLSVLVQEDRDENLSILHTSTSYFLKISPAVQKEDKFTQNLLSISYLPSLIYSGIHSEPWCLQLGFCGIPNPCEKDHLYTLCCLADYQEMFFWERALVIGFSIFIHASNPLLLRSR